MISGKSLVGVALVVATAVVSFVFAGVKTVGAETLASSIQESQTWTKEGSPYIVTRFFEVPEGVTLTLEPGVVVKLGPSVGFKVWGDIVASGIQGEEVTFTSLKDDEVGGDSNGDGDATSPGQGDWGSIDVYENGSLSITGATVRYGGSFLAPIINYRGDVAIASSTITKNSVYDCGLYNEFGDVIIESSDFSYQGVGVCSDGGSLKVSNSRIHEHSRLGIYNAVNGTPSQVDARNNWWGDASGPKHAEKNPAGLGDEILGDVEFSPWLTSDPWFPEETHCCSSIMFLPGLQASRLYTQGSFSSTENRLWEPNSISDVHDLFMDQSGQSIKDDIYTKDVIDEIYGLFTLENIYKSFLSDLKKWKTDDKIIADYAAIPYDWRLTMDEILSYGNNIDGRIYYSGADRATSTPFIIQELRRLVESSKTGRVTIVAHSNGGLLAKALLKKLEEEGDPLVGKIDNVVLVGVPQAGTPQAVGALLHGYDQAIPVGLFPVVMTPATAREFAENMPGAYPLVPSDAYWSGQGGSVSTPIATFQGTGFSPIENAIARYAGSIDSKAEMDEFLAGAEFRTRPKSGDVASPSIVNQGLLEYGNALHDELDLWTPPAHITVHQVAGWGEETLSTIAYRPKIVGCEVEQGGLCTKYKLDWTYKPEMTIDGDGTVVAPSALAMSTTSPNVKRWWVNLNGYNKENINRKHKNILEVEDLRKHIKGIISDNIPQTVHLSKNQPVTPVEDRLAFVLHSPLDLTIVDDSGNMLSSTTSSIPSGTYVRLGEVQYVSVPKNANPTLRLDGYESGFFDLDIEEKSGEAVVASTTFAGIPSATTTRASMVFIDGSIENAANLEVDSDGNGIPDISLEPKEGEVVTMPPYVVDDVAPEARVGFSVDKEEIEITGFDDVSENTDVVVSEQTATVLDKVGNSLTLNYSLKQGKNQTLLEFLNVEYATTTTMSVPMNASIRYHWVKHPKKKDLVVFVAHARTADENIIVVYSGFTNKSRIISIPKVTSGIDLETVEKKMPNGAIIKKVVNELRVPFLETVKGSIRIII